MEQHLIKLLITIVDRGKGAKAAALYRSEHLYFNYICLGPARPTAKSWTILG